MFRTIMNALSPCTTRSTSEDRSPEEAETVPSGCWRGARMLSRHTALDRAVAHGQTMVLLEEARGSSLALRTVQVPRETAQPVVKEECIGKIPWAKKLTLNPMLNPPPAGDIINFDTVESVDRCCLAQGSKYQACYLGESESGRNSIDLPLHPQAGAPRYFLTPPLRGDVVGVAIFEDRIKVFRQKSDREKATAENELFAPELIGAHKSCLFIPDDPAYPKNIPGYVVRYHCDPEIGLTRDEARKDPNAPDVLFWGQYECNPLPTGIGEGEECFLALPTRIGEEWFFGLQEHFPNNRSHITKLVFADGGVFYKYNIL